MKALVTGGAGFIGSNLVDRLLAGGHPVTVVDNFEPFYDPRVKYHNIERHMGSPSFRLIHADIRDTSWIDDLAGQEFDVVVHLAAKAGVRPSLAKPLEYIRTNIEGTQQVLEFARNSGVKQFVYASSSSVYGMNPNIPWDESNTPRPISPYAATKAAGELFGEVYSKLYGIRFIALRFFTVYGPRQRPDLAIHKFLRKILAGEEVPIFGDGSSARDYTYIDDAVEGICRAIEYSGDLFQVFNIGTGQPISLTNMVEVLERVTGTKALIRHLPDQPGDVQATWASTEKAAKLLGYKASVSFEEGIRRFVEWAATAPQKVR